MFLWLATLAGCATPEAPDAGAPDASSDGVTDAGTECVAGDPPGPYGTVLGTRLSPFELSDCAGSPYPLYGDDFCEATLTVVEIQAGWCGPCRLHAGGLQRDFVERYEPRGVRVIEILVQTDDYGEPDLAYCEAWTAQYGLTNPVLIDPSQLTQLYFPGRGLPAILIVDSEGIIRYRQYGVEGGAGPLQDAIDALLAESPGGP